MILSKAIGGYFRIETKSGISYHEKGLALNSGKCFKCILKEREYNHEKNQEFSMVCHDALIVNEINNSSRLYFDWSKKKQICSTKDTLNVQFCSTASIVYRKQAIQPFSNFNLITLENRF